MAAHDAWALVCRLFAGGTPVLRNMLPPREVAALPVLGKAVRPTITDQSFVLCPHCQQHRVQVWGDGRGGRMWRCPGWGAGPLEAAAGGGLGERALRDRVRVGSGGIRVITPKPSTPRGSPFGAGMEWMALEERFTFYGGGITFIGAPPSATPVVIDPATPVNGPFSTDFRWATLPDVQTTPIQFTDGQSKVLGALWSFKGEATTAERIMQRAGLDSAKPSDLFKIKAKDKGKPGPAAQHAAYGALVVTQQRAGLYAMPCAAAGKEVAMT